MRALILAAGLGTRLRPLTALRAKAAMPVNGIPLITRVVRWLVSQGCADLVVNLHHHPQSIAGILGDGAQFGARVRYSWEDPVLGSAGGPRRALPLLLDPRGLPAPPESFLLVNGDTLTSVELQAVAAAHQRRGARVTMALIPNPSPERYGGVTVADGWVTGFTRAGSPGPNFHFIGVQAVRADVFAPLPDGVPAESVMGVYPELMRQDPRSVAAFVVDAPFKDIGTPADYLQTSLELAESEGARLVSSTAVSPSANLRRTIVWEGAEIGPEADLDECIVGDGAKVPGGAAYRRCALLPWSRDAAGPGDTPDGALLVRTF